MVESGLWRLDVNDARLRLTAGVTDVNGRGCDTDRRVGVATGESLSHVPTITCAFKAPFF
jgi:hypothetical protein